MKEMRALAGGEGNQARNPQSSYTSAMTKKKIIGGCLIAAGVVLMIFGDTIPSALAGILTNLGALLLVAAGMAVAFS